MAKMSRGDHSTSYQADIKTLNLSLQQGWNPPLLVISSKIPRLKKITVNLMTGKIPKCFQIQQK